MDELRRFTRPLWRRSVPVHWVGPARICIGDDVLLDRVAPEHIAWLAGLDGARTSVQIARELTIDAADAARIVRALLLVGGIVDAGAMPAGLRWTDRDARPSAQARFAAAIDACADPFDALEMTARRDAARCLVEAPVWLADPLEQALEAAGLPLTRSPDVCTLAVIATSPHPEVPLDHDSPIRLRTHLHVGVRGAHALIGPLVVPGTTSCLRCAHLHRKDADPTWPLRAVQWSQEPLPEADPLLARVVAAYAAVLVRQHVDAPGNVGAWGNQAWRIRMPLAVPEPLGRPIHPLCGCTWHAQHVREASLWESA